MRHEAKSPSAGLPARAVAQPTAAPSRHRASDDVRGALDLAGRLLATLDAGLDAATERADAADRRARALEQRVAALESGEREIAERLVAAERHAGRLMSLYVATYQLHSTLEPAEVQSTIADIAINLLGAARFALLMRGEGDGCEVPLAEGLPDGALSPFQGGRYLGGDTLIDRALARGGLQLGPAPASDALAVVPLAIQGVVVGVVVLFELFEHRPPIDDEDREIFDLVAAHAASALLAARAFSTTDRKLRTLQSLIQLIRGGRA